jgi:hypothetical protein
MSQVAFGPTARYVRVAAAMTLPMAVGVGVVALVALSNALLPEPTSGQIFGTPASWAYMFFWVLVGLPAAGTLSCWIGHQCGHPWAALAPATVGCVGAMWVWIDASVGSYTGMWLVVGVTCSPFVIGYVVPALVVASRARTPEPPPLSGGWREHTPRG